MNSFYTDTYIEWKLRTFTVMSHSTFLQQFRESNGFTEEIVKRVNLAKYSVKSMISSFLVKRMFSRKKVRNIQLKYFVKSTQNQLLAYQLISRNFFIKVVVLRLDPISVVLHKFVIYEGFF